MVGVNCRSDSGDEDSSMALDKLSVGTRVSYTSGNGNYCT